MLTPNQYIRLRIDATTDHVNYADVDDRNHVDTALLLSKSVE